MPALSDREAWTQELDRELPALIESCQHGLDTTPRGNEAKRERLRVADLPGREAYGLSQERDWGAPPA